MKGFKLSQLHPDFNEIDPGSEPFHGRLAILVPKMLIVLFSYSEVKLNPNVADLHRGKTRKSAPDDAARRLGQDEAYLTVREILSEASRVGDGALSRE